MVVLNTKAKKQLISPVTVFTRQFKHKLRGKPKSIKLNNMPNLQNIMHSFDHRELLIC